MFFDTSLLSVNPLKPLPTLYDLAEAHRYSGNYSTSLAWKIPLNSFSFPLSPRSFTIWYFTGACVHDRGECLPRDAAVQQRPSNCISWSLWLGQDSERQSGSPLYDLWLLISDLLLSTSSFLFSSTVYVCEAPSYAEGGAHRRSECDSRGVWSRADCDEPQLVSICKKKTREKKNGARMEKEKRRARGERGDREGDLPERIWLSLSLVV